MLAGPVHLAEQQVSASVMHQQPRSPLSMLSDIKTPSTSLCSAQAHLPSELAWLGRLALQAGQGYLSLTLAVCAELLGHGCACAQP